MSGYPDFYPTVSILDKNSVHVSLSWIMDSQIREKRHQTSKVWAFWACQLAAQTKSIYVEKNVAQTHWYMRVRRVKIKVFKKLLFDKVST